MSPIITAAQHDDLYDRLLDQLGGIGDIEGAIRAENGNAECTDREHSVDPRLLLHDLGLGGGGQSVELTAPPELLRHILSPTARGAMDHAAPSEPELADAFEVKDPRWWQMHGQGRPLRGHPAGARVGP